MRAAAIAAVPLFAALISGPLPAWAADARPCVVTLPSGGVGPDRAADPNCNPGDLLIVVRASGNNGSGNNGSLGPYAARWCTRGGSMASVNVDAAQILVCTYAGPPGGKT